LVSFFALKQVNWQLSGKVESKIKNRMGELFLDGFVEAG
jgi:hypothetical protein